MRKIKNTLLILICFGAMALLASCSSMKPLVVDTRLEISEDFEGQRIMTTVMSEKEFDALFDSDLNKLKEMLADSCPAGMDFEAVMTEDKDVELILTIPFLSYTEYYDKIMRIFSPSDRMNTEDKPAVYYEYSDSLLKKGYAIEENFTSIELFYWLTNAFVSEIPELADMTAEELFENGSTVLVLNGEEIPAGNRIQLSQMESNALDAVTVETTLNDAGSFSMVIDYYAGEEVTQALGGQLTKLMKTLVPESGGLSTRPDDDGGKIYTIKASAVSTSDFVRKLNKALHADNTVFEIVDESDATDSLKAKKKIVLYLDGSYFLDFSDPETSMSYVLKASEEYSFENCESAYNYITSCNFENTEDYCSTVIRMAPSDKITLSLGYSVDMDKIEVDTTMNNEKDFVRTFKFTLTPEQNLVIGEPFEAHISSRLSDAITFEKTESGKNTVYSVTIHAGSAKELSELTCAFLDGRADSGNSSLEGGKTDTERLKKITYAYVDKINLMTFLSGSQSTKGFYYRFQYPKNFTAHFEENNNHENVLEDYNVLTCVTHNKVIEVQTTAQKANVVGILQKVFWFLTLAGMLAVLLLNLGAIMRCIKKHKLDPQEFGLFGHKGYIYVTIFALCAVGFVISTIRLIFGVY